MMVLLVLQTLVVGVLALVVLGLLRSHAEILRRLHDLGVGHLDQGPSGPVGGDRRGGAAEPATAAPTAGPGWTVIPPAVAPGTPAPPVAATGRPAHDVAGATPGGGSASVAVVGAPHRTVLAFLTSGCGTCADYWDAFDQRPVRHGRLVVVTRGPDQESPAAVRRLAPSSATTIMSNEAWESYDVPGSPYVVLVDGPSGLVVGEGTGASWEQVDRLLEQAAADVPLGHGVDAREAEVDQALRAAGITPGHASLHGGEAGEG